jgi:hypothetical protein
MYFFGLKIPSFASISSHWFLYFLIPVCMSMLVIIQKYVDIKKANVHSAIAVITITGVFIS